MRSAALKESFSLIAVALVATSFAACSVQVDVDGGRCDETHPCSPGWTCGVDGWCGQPGATDGGGDSGTPLVLGAPCANWRQCDSGFCVDGVCCDGACTGACVACNRSGKEGTCTHAAPRTDPEDECGTHYCRASGGCATSCESDEECKLGSCDSTGGSSRACE